MDDYPLLNLFWTMLMFMFIFLWISVVVSIFLDNFRRTDHGGWAKALWMLFIVFLPVLGVFAYMIARPQMTEQDKELITSMQERQRRIEGYSSSDEIAKAKALLDSGAIDAGEFERLKQRALA